MCWIVYSLCLAMTETWLSDKDGNSRFPTNTTHVITPVWHQSKLAEEMKNL